MHTGARSVGLGNRDRDIRAEASDGEEGQKLELGQIWTRGSSYGCCSMCLRICFSIVLSGHAKMVGVFRVL